jgi:hypothetical protein
MKGMFSAAVHFGGDLRQWTVSNETDLDGIFGGGPQQFNGRIGA